MEEFDFDVPVNLFHLSYLNGKEATYKEVQEDINRAREKYFDVPEIQLKLDRRQTALDELKKQLNEERGQVISPN